MAEWRKVNAHCIRSGDWQITRVRVMDVDRFIVWDMSKRPPELKGIKDTAGEAKQVTTETSEGDV